MFRRSVPILVALAAAAAPFPAQSRVISVSTGGTTRVSKPPRKPITMFYASYLSQEQVQLWPTPGHVEVGQRYEMVDDRGWVGTVEVSTVTQQDINGCGEMNDVGIADFIGAPRWGNYGSIWAVGPGARVTTRAKQIAYNEVTSAPPGNRTQMIFLDLDGDRDPEVARFTSYDCEILPNGQVQQTQGNGVTCYVIWSRTDGSTWRVSERGEQQPCY
jgi:hypothetical protein